jgi:hypothetical protein
MSERITRRGLLGRLLAGLLAPFGCRAGAQASPPAPPTPPPPVLPAPASYLAGGPVTTYVYDAVGQVTHPGGTGTATTLTYDPGRAT